MQPFGLMNLLKFALQASEQNQTPPAATQTGEFGDSQADFSPPNSTENSPPERGRTSEDDMLSQKEDAYRAFVEKHDRTSQKIKQNQR